jgi:hypothetical protein
LYPNYFWWHQLVTFPTLHVCGITVEFTLPHLVVLLSPQMPVGFVTRIEQRQVDPVPNTWTGDFTFLQDIHGEPTC